MLLVNLPCLLYFFESLYGFYHISESNSKITYMKLRLTLILFCLLGIGLFAKAQDKKKNQSKPTVENGADAIPVIVKSNKKARHPKPPPPPPMIVKDGKVAAPPKVEVIKFVPPKMRKDVEKAPPPPPVKPIKEGGYSSVGTSF